MGSHKNCRNLCIRLRMMPGEAPGGRGGNGQPGAGSVLTPLSTAEAAALQEAILEEYGAFNLYQSAMAQVGNVVPFSQIALAEQQHINILVRQAGTNTAWRFPLIRAWPPSPALANSGRGLPGGRER